MTTTRGKVLPPGVVNREQLDEEYENLVKATAFRGPLNGVERAFVEAQRFGKSKAAFKADVMARRASLGFGKNENHRMF